MLDMASIAVTLNGLKTATEFAKYLRNTDKAFTSAELKLQIADLVDSLADARMALSDVKETVAEKDAEIKRLEDALKLKGDVVRYLDAYYYKNEIGEPCGDPLCSHCFETKHVLVHIHQDPAARGLSNCPSCKTVVAWQHRKSACPQTSD